MLGSAGGGGADGVPADDAVTSLDMCVGSDCLVAGHGSGRILLWDYLRYGEDVFVIPRYCAVMLYAHCLNKVAGF